MIKKEAEFLENRQELRDSIKLFRETNIDDKDGMESFFTCDLPKLLKTSQKLKTEDILLLSISSTAANSCSC